MSETTISEATSTIPILKSVRRPRDFNPSDRLPFSSLMAGGGLIEVGQFGFGGSSQEGKGFAAGFQEVVQVSLTLT